MDVLVTGSSGLVGSALVRALEARGDRVRRLVRRPSKGEGRFLWDPEAGTLDERALDGADAVVHLAGESIAGGPWTEGRKARVRESRVRGTRLLAEAMARSPRAPKVFVSASAIGFYGDTGDHAVDESSPNGTGFLADVCRAWEAATEPAERAGVRVVITRFGVILAKEGGALEKMAIPFKLGLGGRLGDGRQYFPWVALDDVVRAILFALDDPELRGPVNVTAPRPVTNGELTKALGHVLHRPTVLPVPAFALRLALGGEMAQHVFLGSSRVLPKKLRDAGFTFAQTDLEGALRTYLGREPKTVDRGA